MADENCTICGKPKTSEKSGTLTQFISLCRCNELKVDPSLSDSLKILICSKCNKRINQSRPGTITQYIFRSDSCECEEPEPVETKTSRFEPKVFEGFVESEEEEELKVNPDDFPLDRYKPLNVLGAGASGSVFLARDRLMGNRVAIKTLHVLSKEQLLLFQEEARATSKLEHPNIIRILNFGATKSGTPFMVLEYFSGTTLEVCLRELRPMDWSLARSIILKVAEALAYSHRQGIYHRDLKPSNILVSGIGSEELTVRLIDFGVAKAFELAGDSVEFQGQTIVGTPHYMSPDVLNELDYTAASEIYSVGCILFEMLAGSPPYEAESSMALLSLHAHGEPPDLSHKLEQEVPEELADIGMKCLEKNPGDRFQTMELLIDALKSVEVADEIQKETGVHLEDDREVRSIVHSPMFIAGFTVVLLVAVGAVVLNIASTQRVEKTETNTPEAEMVIEETPAEVYFKKGNKARKNNNLVKAERMFSRVLELEPKHQYALYERASLRYNLKEYKASLEDSRKLIELYPDNYLGYGLEGMNLRRLGDMKSAIASYDRALELNPEYYRAHFMKGNIYLVTGKYKQAIEAFNKAQMPSSDNLYCLLQLNKAAAFSYQKKYSKALECLDESMKSRPDWASPYYDKILVLSQMGKAEEAIRLADQAVKIFPRDNKIRNLRLKLLVKVKRK